MALPLSWDWLKNGSGALWSSCWRCFSSFPQHLLVTTSCHVPGTQVDWDTGAPFLEHQNQSVNASCPRMLSLWDPNVTKHWVTSITPDPSSYTSFYWSLLPLSSPSPRADRKRSLSLLTTSLPASGFSHLIHSPFLLLWWSPLVTKQLRGASPAPCLRAGLLMLPNPICPKGTEQGWILFRVRGAVLSYLGGCVALGPKGELHRYLRRAPSSSRGNFSTKNPEISRSTSIHWYVGMASSLG